MFYCEIVKDNLYLYKIYLSNFIIKSFFQNVINDKLNKLCFNFYECGIFHIK